MLTSQKEKNKKEFERYLKTTLERYRLYKRVIDEFNEKGELDKKTKREIEAETGYNDFNDLEKLRQYFNESEFLSVEKQSQNFQTGIITYQLQISTGGPGDEFIVGVNDNGEIESILYVFLPWFEGFEKEMVGEDFDVIKGVLEMFVYFDFNVKE